MTNREMIVEVLKQHSCLTGSEIKNFVYRKFGVNISPQTAAGVMRPLIAAGMAAKSQHPSSNKMVYWLTDYGEEKMK